MANNIFLRLSVNKNNLYERFDRALVEVGWQVQTIFSVRLLSDFYNESNGNKRLVCLAILNPKDFYFNQDDLRCIERFSSAGHALIVGSGSYEDTSKRANLNAIVSKYGIKFRKNSVIRPNRFEHYHPKEAMIQGFIANRGLRDSLKRVSDQTSNHGDEAGNARGTGERIIYPYGCSIKVDNKSSVVMMTSSKWTIPMEQPICTFYRDPSNNIDGFKLIAIGSASIFEDTYINKECNLSLLKSFSDFILNANGFVINISDAKTIEIPTVNYSPDIDRLISIPVPYIQQTEPLPEDKSSLIDQKTFNLDNSKLPLLIEAFRELDITKEPLTLIKPNFERHQLSLEPAVHGFLIRRYDKDIE